MPSNTYAKELILCYLNGLRVQGFAEGDFLTIAQNEDSVTIERGSGGEATFNHRQISDATATLTLHGGSAAIDVLQRLWDQQNASYAFAFSFELVDPLATNKRTSAPFCKISRSPDQTYGDTVGTVEWTILMTQATIRHSGRVQLG